ncbi:YggS family pyridoxal phosphate-dependent enzyme, partial [Spirulina sp. 06S082]|uniref:YggS family pyridoxal phosphate-dependent enzyme n=1 Tax=Spirulina sp. 06S082 TaxID=3110248 RepID=UPI002B216862
DRLERIYQQLPSGVRAIAVSKQVSLEAMREAYQAGVRDFAESRIQEALPKQEQLQDLKDICWHFIGHIQSNKAKKAIEHFDWIHSCDSLKLAQRLNSLAADIQRNPKICLQVKILPDANKYGWSQSELLADLPQLDRLSHLEIQGLMTILPMGLSDAEKLAAFHTTKELRDQIAQDPRIDLTLPELSMGMSGDYPLALQAGATMIRPGRIIFGDRPSP